MPRLFFFNAANWIPENKVTEGDVDRMGTHTAPGGPIWGSEPTSNANDPGVPGHAKFSRAPAQPGLAATQQRWQTRCEGLPHRGGRMGARNILGCPQERPRNASTIKLTASGSKKL